jgi:predicted transcriptional regulator
MKENSMRTVQFTLEEAIEVCKALSNEHRMDILKVLSQGPLNVNELAEILQLPFSTTSVNLKKLVEAGLVTNGTEPGRGAQKFSVKNYDRVVINLVSPKEEDENSVIVSMPIGEFVDCEVEPTCGLLSENGFIGVQDDPRSFYEPERKNAQKVCFRAGYIDYRFPNRAPYGSVVDQLEFSAEICSEAPYYKLDWPSDITVSVNKVEIGTWTCPGDYGGERGFLTPDWYGPNNSQYGLLKHWVVNNEGSYIDGMRISDVTVNDLELPLKPYISLKFEVKKDALNVGGMNLFGKKFGNYEQDIIMKIKYSNKR